MAEEQIAICWARGPSDVAAAFALRTEVFCGEQGVPPEMEIDEHDPEAQHLVALLAEEQRVIGTLRLLSFGAEAKIGRVVVASDWRRRGVASRMLVAAVARARQQGFRQVRLAAQVVSVAVYERAGFSVESEPFEQAGIEHVWMGLSLSS